MFKIDLKYFRFEKKDLGLWLTLALPLIFHQTTLSLLHSWSADHSNTYSHGSLLTLVALGILISNYYKNRNQLYINNSRFCLLLIILFLPVWLFATISFTQIVAQLVLIVLIGISFCYFYGNRAILHAYTTVALLIASTSAWAIFNTPLRIISAYASSFLLNLTGFTNFRDNFLIHIPVGTFHVDSGCSGLSQFIVAIAIGFIYAWHVKLNITRTVIAVAMAIVCAIIANILRIYIIIALGQMTNMQHHFVVVEHTSLGWGVFAVCIYLFFLVSARFLEKNINEKSTTTNHIHSKTNLTSAMLIFLILNISISMYASHLLAPKKDQNLPIEIPTLWQEQPYLSSWQPIVNGASQELHISIPYEGKNINLHLYFYNQQSQDNEAVNNINKIADNNWVVKRLKNLGGTYNAYKLTNHSKTKNAALQAYWVNGQFYRSDIKAKLINSINIIKGNPYIAFIAIGSSYKNIKALENFAKYETDNINQILQKHTQKLYSLN